MRQGFDKLRLGGCKTLLVSLGTLPGCLQLLRKSCLLTLARAGGSGFAGSRQRTPQALFQLFHALLQDDIILSCRLEAGLLARDLFIPRLDIQLQPAQTREIEPAGTADQMRQHMHLAENSVHQRTIAGRVAHDGPIGSRYIAVIDGPVPPRLDLRRYREL